MSEIFYISPWDYAVYFDYTIFFLIAWAVILCFKGTILDNKVVAINQIYAVEFRKIAKSPDQFSWIRSKEWLWDIMMLFFAKYGNIHQLFLLCASVYVGALWLAMRRIFKEYNYIPYLIILCMFTFWTYGVNGVRNGMGASLFILAMTYTSNIPMMIGIALLGAGVHNSVYLMLAGATLSWFVNHSKLYIVIWGASILISLVFGNQIQELLSSFAYDMAGENKLTGYLSYTEAQMLSDGLIVSRSFRWDFIAYSALGVGVGYYFIFKREFKDLYYHWIYNTFLLCNTFWILIIRAPYSNRFAQISWFIMPVVLIYPFFKDRFWINHEKMIGFGIMTFYSFTFFTMMLPHLLSLF